jgi:ubiquitin thioesterase protein OTUB1
MWKEESPSHSIHFHVSSYLVKDESLQWAVNVGGYQEMTIEIFYDSLVELLEQLDKISLEDLVKELNHENATSDYCTWYLRAMTATVLKSDPERFLPFVMGENYYDIPSFCQAEIDPMGKECGQVQVLALAEYFGVSLVVEYLDGHAFQDKLTQHSFGKEDSPTKISLLYRPGHYDILYPKQSVS